MAIGRAGRLGREVAGPEPIRMADIAPLNDVFSDAFTERYRRDGMVGVRVPHLNPLIWRYAIEDARGGAMCWRDERGQLVAFNVAHLSGREGWMGPLAVKPEWQGLGLGRAVVEAGIRWLEDAEAQTIGLETMPRTMDNIGFYSTIGFVPGRLTITVTLDAAAAAHGATVLGQLGAAARESALEEAAALATALVPGVEFRREMGLTLDLGVGDTVLLHDRGTLVGFALCHVVPLVEGRGREELRVLKLALADAGHADAMFAAIADYAWRAGCRRLAVRVQGEYDALYRRMIQLGGRVRWTDLRMALARAPERPLARGVLLSNWEI